MHFKPSGIIPIAFGIYMLLMVHRVIRRKPKDPEKMELWHRKSDTMMKIISPLLIGFGLLELFGIL